MRLDSRCLGNDKTGAAVCCRESEGVPRLDSLESLFDKEALREFGAKGLKRDSETASRRRYGPSLQ